jgi:hypothetical protein
MEQPWQVQVPADLPADHEIGPTPCSQTFCLGRPEDAAKHWQSKHIAEVDISSSMPAGASRPCSLHDQHNSRGGSFEIFLDPLSCLIVRFLPDHPTIRTGMPSKRDLPGLPLIFKGLDHVISQDINESLLRVGICQWNTCGLQLQFRMCKHIPLPRLSLTLSHAVLVVVGSARGSNEASTVFALRWSFRKESIL